MTYKRLSRVMLGSSLFFAVTARGEWSSDHAKNLVISDASETIFAHPKIASLPDKSWYVSWFRFYDNSDDDGSVILQRLSSSGEEKLPHNGIHATKLGSRTTADFGIDTDAKGNALLAFSDRLKRSEDAQISVTKISPSGQALWGDLGVRLMSKSDVRRPKVAVTSDDGVVVGWTARNQVILQKLNGEGQPLWTRTSEIQPGVVLSEAGFKYELADLHASDDGSVIVSFHRLKSDTSPKHLYANKIAADGTTLWGKEHVKIFDGGTLYMGVGSSFVSDGKGGAIFAWYSWVPRLQGFVQHIRADGNEVFRHNGEAISTSTRRFRSMISVSYREDTQEIFLFWQEMVVNNFKRRHGLYGQKLSANGERQWGDDGLVIVPIGEHYIGHINATQAEDGMFVFWTEELNRRESKGTLQGVKLDQGGKVICSQFPVSSTPSKKSWLDIGIDPSGRQVALAWQDHPADRGIQIQMQNVNLDCSLGVAR